LYHDHAIYILGGHDTTRNQSLNTCQKYDILTGRWSFMTPFRENRFNASATVVNDKILIAGGTNEQKTFLNSVEIMSLNENSWEKCLFFCTEPIYGCQMLPVGENKILLLGGVRLHAGFCKSIEEFDVEKHTWRRLENMKQQRENFETFAHQNIVYVFGGNKNIKNLDTLGERYSLHENTWRVLEFGVLEHGSERFKSGKRMKGMAKQKCKDVSLNIKKMCKNYNIVDVAAAMIFE